MRGVLEAVVELHGKSEMGPTLIMEGDAQIKGDRDQIIRLFGNLVLNAQQAIGSRPGKVEIRVNAEVSEVEVEDNGPGMPPEVAHKAFEPRFTTRGSGTGLGLAIVKAIADRHQWAVEFNSEEGKGTRFLIRLKP
jgi:signal transduction histidine kinase